MESYTAVIDLVGVQQLAGSVFTLGMLVSRRLHQFGGESVRSFVDSVVKPEIVTFDVGCLMAGIVLPGWWMNQLQAASESTDITDFISLKRLVVQLVVDGPAWSSATADALRCLFFESSLREQLETRAEPEGTRSRAITGRSEKARRCPIFLYRLGRKGMYGVIHVTLVRVVAGFDLGPSGTTLEVRLRDAAEALSVTHTLKLPGMTPVDPVRAFSP